MKYSDNRTEDEKDTNCTEETLKARIKSLEEKNLSLSSQIMNLNKSSEAKTNEIEKLQTQLDEAYERIREYSQLANISNNRDKEYLKKFDDVNYSILPSCNTDFASLCQPLHGPDGWYLKRWADLRKDGKYNTFPNNAKMFSSKTRDKIALREGITTKNFFGIWNWSEKQNENPQNKDDLSLEYNTKIHAIEIVIIPKARSLDKVIEVLQQGLEYQPHSQKIMFSYKNFEGTYSGILCDLKDLTISNNQVSFSDDLISVLIYDFNKGDILSLNNGLSFYNGAFLGIPKEKYNLKTNLEIVKDLFLSSISWSDYKSVDISKTKFQELKSRIEAIPTDDIITKIMEACYCSNLIAQNLFDEFLGKVTQYFKGNSLEDEVLRHVIGLDPELKNRTEEQLFKDWEKENEYLLTQKKELETKLDTLSNKCKKEENVLYQIQSEEARLRTLITKNEKLANDVEKAVANKIQNACDDIADFIANMAFVVGKKATDKNTQSSKTLKTDLNLYEVFHANENPEDLEIHHTWEDVIDTTILELIEAGVAESYRKGLAIFLCAAYIKRQPVLLIGPNAIDIAQAFSAALTARQYGILNCEGNYSRPNVKKIGLKGETIVIINSLLTNDWRNRLPEILSNKSVFFIATHPFSEDVQVEPKSLYDFILPLFTESFVDEPANRKFIGGYFSKDFPLLKDPEDSPQDILKISKLSLSPLVKNRIKSLISTMRAINPDLTEDEKFLFCIFPIIYATTANLQLDEEINRLFLEFGISKTLKRDLRFILERTNE